MRNRPFLKWLGNKFRISDKIISHLPKNKVLAEPFVGSGAIFLNTDYEYYHLNDINKQLINLYENLKSNQTEFINFCKQYFERQYNSEKQYYILRNIFNETKDKQLQAALFLYLNRHGYNGLCRYNKSGLFNVPFGRYNKPYFPEEQMLNFAQKAQRAVFTSMSFSTFMLKFKTKKVTIYCDPPYSPLSKTANFTMYSGDQFLHDDHIKLKNIANDLVEYGNTVFISNHNTPITRKLYSGIKLKKFYAPRMVSAISSKRKPVSELLACFGNKK